MEENQFMIFAREFLFLKMLHSPLERILKQLKAWLAITLLLLTSVFSLIMAIISVCLGGYYKASWAFPKGYHLPSSQGKQGHLREWMCKRREGLCWTFHWWTRQPHLPHLPPVPPSFRNQLVLQDLCSDWRDHIWYANKYFISPSVQLQ